jgi:hypothetical protein
MQIDLLATVLVCLFLPVQNTFIEVKQSKTFVELWCGGDDNLTQGVCRALESEFASSRDFVVLADESNNERQVKLIVTIPTNVDWRDRGTRTRVFYTVEFRSSTDRKLGKKTGACWENELKTCASQIVRHAKTATRKLTD